MHSVCIKRKKTPMLTILKNIHFTRLVKAGDGLKEFNFRKQSNATVPTFQVDVTDERANRIIFTLQKVEGAWIMSPLSLPAWVKEVQPVLLEIVEDGQNQNELNFLP
jgi:hypothetical protein